MCVISSPFRSRFEGHNPGDGKLRSWMLDSPVWSGIPIRSVGCLRSDPAQGACRLSSSGRRSPIFGQYQRIAPFCDGRSGILDLPFEPRRQRSWIVRRSEVVVADKCPNKGLAMENAPYYRGQAERARRLAHSLTNREVEALLERIAQDYDDIAVDLENGAIEVRPPELMPQSQD